MRWLLTRVQLSPASSERKSPPLSPAASTWAHTRFGSAGETETPILPTRTSVGSPLVSFVQWSPPSVDLKTPPSMLPLSIVHGWRCTAHMPA